MSCLAEQPLWPAEGMRKGDFIALVWSKAAPLYRDLPWRGIDDPYGVLVSEVMLQQTQVKRVMGRWERFMRMFPTPDALAAADTAELLGEWQGMGYNRRALMLKRACEICSAEYAGKMPARYEDLISLPGVGPSSAAGVMAFAYNQPAVYVETNVRTVFIHHMFPNQDKVPDRQIVPLVRDCCPEDKPRAWYYALLDYGAHLKAIGGRGGDAGRRSASYSRQSAFEGSRRQKRAEALRYVLDHPGAAVQDVDAYLDGFERQHRRAGVPAGLTQSILDDLAAEGFFACREGRYFA